MNIERLQFNAYKKSHIVHAESHIMHVQKSVDEYKKFIGYYINIIECKED